MNRIKPAIKWSGSKSSQADKIIKNLPPSFNTYHEPFVGGGSMLYAIEPKKAYAYDICEPLIHFWKLVKENPEKIIKSYQKNWTKLQKIGHEYYYEVRDSFNRNQSGEELLFLSRTCVNGLIRFNKKGEFNNSFHHTRKGINPKTLEAIIIDWNTKVRNTSFTHGDYEKSLKYIKKGDLVYLDPPYFNTKGRYFGGIDQDRFLLYIKNLNEVGAYVIMSFDGQRGDNVYNYNKNIDEVFKRKLLLKSGLSSFRKVIDKKNEDVYESLLLNW